MSKNQRKFQYRAMDQATGDIARGVVTASSKISLEGILKESNLILISAREMRETNLISFGGRITDKDLISFFLHLHQLERAGVQLLTSISDLKGSSEKQQMKDMSQNIYESIKGGKLLSESMKSHKKVFDNTMISLVAMGERTGNLELAFKNIFDNLKWNLDFKKKIVKAVRYPMFSLLVMFLVTTIMLKVVVPKVIKFVIGQGIEIPVYTNALIATSNFFSKYFIFFIVIPLGLKIILKFIAKINQKAGRRLDFIKLYLPLIGKIIKKIELSRFTKFFGVTFSSGIEVLKCLEISGGVVNNTAIKYEVEKIKRKVSDGSSVSSAIEASGYFPGLVVRMFKVGEESGNIQDAMENIQYFYDAEINDSIDKIVGSIQPIIIFFMGGLMAWVVLAVFGPIYGNFSQMQ